MVTEQMLRDEFLKYFQPDEATLLDVGIGEGSPYYRDVRQRFLVQIKYHKLDIIKVYGWSVSKYCKDEKERWMVTGDGYQFKDIRRHYLKLIADKEEAAEKKKKAKNGPSLNSVKGEV